MRIVSFNINGLRARLAETKSLSSFLDSLNADIICLQETKVTRQELTADIAVAEGYESFFSCTRTVGKGRTAYSGVATFCRVCLTSSTTSPILPLAADEGFTGLLHFSPTPNMGSGNGRVGCYEEVYQTGLSSQELLRLDSEGRCLITDHGCFVLFNIYAPRVEEGDKDRLDFKVNFFHTLQRRWGGLLSKGRRIIAVGDFNICPYPIDHCEPGSDFDKNILRTWLRSILHNEGGPFRDVFRFIHPDRKEAFTCWASNTGAEEFNYGTRIDLILAGGPCGHELSGDEEVSHRAHGFVECEVQDADIVTEFRRAKADTLPRWYGGRSLKLEGSDHAPVYVRLQEQSQVKPHDVPPLAARFMPELRGRQQNLVALLKRQPTTLTSSIQDVASTENNVSPFTHKRHPSLSSFRDQSNDKKKKAKVSNLSNKQIASTQSQKQSNLRTFFVSSTSNKKASVALQVNGTHENVKPTCSQIILYNNSDMRGEQSIGDSDTLPVLLSETKTENTSFVDEVSQQGVSPQSAISVDLDTSGTLGTPDEQDYSAKDQTDSQQYSQLGQSYASKAQQKLDAASEWRRIQTVMARAVPLCHGHKEPCVKRVVKKGPNTGRGFYVCARAKGPSSNPDARCDHFSWSSSSKNGKAPSK